MRGRNNNGEFEPDSLVWFDDGSGVDYYVPGTIAEIKEDTAVVYADGQAHDVPLASLRPRDDTGVEGCADMVNLRDLHEGAILYNLKKRFHRTSIYTYIGDILISVNPYQMYNIYGLNTVHQYKNQLVGKLPPHIFAIGNACHYNMMKNRQDQVIVISGESGSGKTESTKLLMQYLAAADSTKSNLITEQVLESAPLLESFGNAKTYINNNSSRFGKYIEILFENGRIVGAQLSEYLLEKSRIVHQVQGDRNFHIFYEMLAGLSVKDLKEMGLTHPENFFYLNQGTFKISLKNDAQDFQQVISALEVLGINAEERNGIFSILAAILHLGNIYYGRTQRNGQEAAVIMNNVEVDFISKLLLVENDGVAKSLTQKVTSAAGERFHSPFNVEQALDSRDGLARALYSRLFTWLVLKINQVFAPQKTESEYSKIAILDIFGFEDFQRNGFEQFCINYANEHLQSFLVDHIFKEEMEMYEDEKVIFNPIDYEDNQECLEMIAKPPIGIISILNDESSFPQATDLSFLEKCHQQHGQNKHYDKPKVNGAVFGIYHYAGIVKYQADMFLDKNRDIVRAELFDLLISSRSNFIANLFPEYVDNPSVHLSQATFSVFNELQNGENSLTKRNKYNMGYISTVMGSFNESLNNLIEKMDESAPHFIRCIRPNVEKSSVLFQDGLVLSQLISTGMMDTIKIRQSGFPIRIAFQPFVQRYFCLHGPQKLSLKNPPYENTKKICDCVSKGNEELKQEFQVGKTMVFMRETFERYMEEARYQKLRDNAILIQKNVKRWITENEYQSKKERIVVLQSYTRGFLARKQYHRTLDGIIKFQSLYRMYKHRKMFLHNRTNELTRISKRQREYLTQVHYSDKLEFEKIVDVTRFDIPPDLAVVFSRIHLWDPLHVDYHICGVNNITQWDYSEQTMPGDIDICPFTKFAKLFFQDKSRFSYTRVPLKSSLLKLRYASILESVMSFKLIMRFMEDESMTGLRQLVLGNYIVNKGIRHRDLRDEIYSQLCMQTWKNPHEQSLKRGWLLIGLCLCCFPPTQRMYKYLLKYVSDQATGGYKSYLQRKILCWEQDSPGRLFPPCLLEWKALKETANLALECDMSDGYQRIIEVESSAKSENVAKSFLNIRDIADPAISGWSFYLQYERSCRLDIAGSDCLLDLVGVLEQPPGFPCSLAGSVVSIDRSNPIPSDRRETVIEAHKALTNRTQVDRLRQVYSDELSAQPLVLHQRQQQPPPNISYDYNEHVQTSSEEYPLYSTIPLRSIQNNEVFPQNVLFNDNIYENGEFIKRNMHMFNWNDVQISQQQRQMIELEQRRQEIAEQERLMLLRNAPPPPVPPPPPPILTSASASAASSRVNTLKKNEKKKIPKTPWSMDEVLERSVELKLKRDERASASTSSDYMLDNTAKRDPVFEKTLYSKIVDLKNSPMRRRPALPSNESYSVGEMLAQNRKLRKNSSKIISMNNDFRATGSPHRSPNKNDDNNKSPTILGHSGGSLSKRSKNRFEDKSRKFEEYKKSLRSLHDKPNSVGKSSDVSAYVDRLFDPVYASEGALTNGNALVGKLRGGGKRIFYPNRSSFASNAPIYSSITSNSSQVQLIDQLLLQQQQLQDTLDKIKSEGRVRWNSATIPVTPEPKRVSFQNNENSSVFPPDMSSTDAMSNWNIPPPPNFPPPPPPPEPNHPDLNKSIRAPPNGIKDVIKGFEDQGIAPEPVQDLSIPHRVQHLDNQHSATVFSDQFTRSILYSRGSDSYLTYGNTRWKVFLKKEIFLPNEIMNATLKNLIYRQILEDLGSRTCSRLSGEDRYQMQRLLAKTMTQESIIYAAKDLPLYFSRIFRINGYAENRLSSYLAISHSGIRFASRANLDEELNTTAHFKYSDVIDVSSADERVTLDTVTKKFVLYTSKAGAIKKLIYLYVKASDGSEKFVQALADFAAPNKEYLSFKRGAVIRIFDKKDLEPGCLWGVLGDYRGKFPIQIVEDHNNTTSASVAVGWGPSVVPSKRANEKTEDDEQYSMVEFAKRFFRQYEALDTSPPRQSDVETPSKSLVAIAEYSKEPINVSLINFNNKSLSRQATDIFKAIMKFMGDWKRDRQESNGELVAFVLKTGREVLDMRDEIFCQLAKQTTNNKSDNRESCSRGWKLLMLCSAYFDCSQLLRPYLNKFFQSAGDPKRDFSAAANICELNLTRSFKYGGRRNMPSENELFMLMQGKHAKHQLVTLPGNVQRLCKIQTSTTAFDIIKDTCNEMGLYTPHEQEEYGLFTFLEDQNLLLSIQNQDYIFDVFASLARQHNSKTLKYGLAFRKTIWFHTMRFGNNLFTEVIYNQILPNVTNGYILHYRGNRNSHIRDQQTQNEISLLAALRHRASDEHNPPNVNEVSQLIPDVVSSLLSPDQWVHAVHSHFFLIRHFTVTNARTKFVELISAWYYFGSSFFYIKHCTHASINGECILAINKNGVHFLATRSRDTYLSLAYSEIISTRHLRSDSGRVFVDLKCGNLLVQRVTRIETPRGKEISSLIGKYIKCISLEKQKGENNSISYV